MPIGITVIGARGKMGTRVISLAQADSDFTVEENFERADVVIDFSSKDNLSSVLGLQKPLVIGTTGHVNTREMEIAAKNIPILFSPNFSLGMAAMLEAAALLAKKGFSIDIIEAHHNQKKDKPSGSALALARAIGKDIPIHSIRSGDIIGDHTVIFVGEGERIELKHQVFSRDAFAKGALKAAKFLAKKPPGLYSLKDLFL